MWSRGITWRSQVGANPIPIAHPTNLALFGHKTTLSIQAGGGLKSEQGAESPLTPLTLTTGFTSNVMHAVSVEICKDRSTEIICTCFHTDCGTFSAVSHSSFNVVTCGSLSSSSKSTERLKQQSVMKFLKPSKLKTLSCHAVFVVPNLHVRLANHTTLLLQSASIYPEVSTGNLWR